MSSADHALTAIGQGVVTASPVQMASVAATLAKGGIRFRAHLLGGTESVEIPSLEEEGISADHIETIRKAMWGVVNDDEGSASSLRSDQLEIAGKTATAQTGHQDRPRNAWFMGFAPYENPKLALCVLVEGGESGSRVAGPIAQRILMEGIAHLQDN